MQVKRLRLFFAASLGGIASFLILLPSPIIPLQMLIKLLVTALILLVAFRTNLRGYFKAFIWYILFNCLFAGLLLLFQFSGGQFQSNNMQFYFDISAMTLIFTTIVLYLTLTLIRYIFKEHSGSEPMFLELRHNNLCFRLTACYDSGFRAHDILQGAPLVLIGYPSCKTELPFEICIALEKYFSEGMPGEGFSVLPLDGVGGSELTATLFPVSVLSNDKKIDSIKLCFSNKHIDVGGAHCLLSKEFMEVMTNAHKNHVTE